jgi:hypothetical protein
MEPFAGSLLRNAGNLRLDQFRTMEIKPRCARTAAIEASVTGLDAK